MKWVTHGLSNCPACDYLDGTVAAVDEFDVTPGFHDNCDCSLEPVDVYDNWSLLKPKRFFSWKNIFTFIDINLFRVSSMKALEPRASDMKAHSPDNQIPHFNTFNMKYMSDKYYFIYGFEAIKDYFQPSYKKTLGYERRFNRYSAYYRYSRYRYSGR